MSFLVSKLLLKNDTKITEKEKQILTFIINNGPSKVIEISNALGISITTIKNVEKSRTEFQRINELCVTKNVSWTFRKVAYGFYFDFIRTNVQINVHLTDQEQAIFNLILSNERITFKTPKIILLGEKHFYILWNKNKIKVPHRRLSWKIIFLI